MRRVKQGAGDRWGVFTQNFQQGAAEIQNLAAGYNFVIQSLKAGRFNFKKFYQSDVDNFCCAIFRIC